MPTAPYSEIMDISSLADYQVGAIVSRQITKAEGGNVTLFAFDEGQELSEHTTPFDALVQVLDGEVEIKISGNPYLLIGRSIHSHARQSPPRLEGHKKIQDALDHDQGINI